MIILRFECGESAVPELVLIDGERGRGGEAHLSGWSIVETTNCWNNSHFLLPIQAKYIVVFVAVWIVTYSNEKDILLQ